MQYFRISGIVAGAQYSATQTTTAAKPTKYIHMKLIVRYSGIHSVKALDSIVRQEILALEPLRQIDEAMVHVYREHETSPPFRVHVHLVTPGPDVFAEARDHTLAAALAKVMKQLAHEIDTRVGKRLARIKSNLQAPTPRLPSSRSAR